MNCDEARRLLDSFLDQELQPGARSQLEEHLRSCAACRCLSWETEEFRSFFRNHAPIYQAPPELRTKILNSARQSLKKPAPRLFLPIWMYATAALVVISLAGLVVWLPNRENGISKLAVLEYSQSLAADHLVDVAAAEPKALRPWFAARVGFTPPAIDLLPFGYRFEGGRVAVLDKRSVVALVYKREDNVLTIFCWPPNVDAVGYGARSILGYRVYTWSNSACNYILVSKSNDPKIDEFVDAAQEQPNPTFY